MLNRIKNIENFCSK